MPFTEKLNQELMFAGRQYKRLFGLEIVIPSPGLHARPIGQTVSGLSEEFNAYVTGGHGERFPVVVRTPLREIDE